MIRRMPSMNSVSSTPCSAASSVGRPSNASDDRPSWLSLLGDLETAEAFEPDGIQHPFDDDPVISRLSYLHDGVFRTSHSLGSLLAQRLTVLS